MYVCKHHRVMYAKGINTFLNHYVLAFKVSQCMLDYETIYELSKMSKYMLLMLLK